jgi:hypothetical protein
VRPESRKLAQSLLETYRAVVPEKYESTVARKGIAGMKGKAIDPSQLETATNRKEEGRSARE